MARPSAQTRARRLLGMMHLLRPGMVAPLSALADSLGVSVADVTADLELLACCGLHPYSPDTLVPVFVEDGEMVVFGRMPALERAVRLSQKEALALAAALQAAGLTHDDALVRKLLDAAAASDVSAEDLEHVVRAAVAPSTGEPLKAISLGLKESRAVHIAYQAAGREEVTERDIEPVAIFGERGAWYAEAFCRRAGALRTFRLDRIVSASVTEERFVPRDLSPGGVPFSTEGLPVATIRLDPEEGFTAREWPGVRLVAEDSRGTVVEIPYAGTGWIARQVVARLGAAEVIEPDEVRAAVRELATRAAEL